MQEWWRPDRFAARRGRLEQRGRILGAVRGFFAAHAYVEVGTPRPRTGSIRSRKMRK